MTSAVLAAYCNGGTRVTLLPDGTKIRVQKSDEPPRFFEQTDLKITDWCDGACSWCHERSTKRGKHAQIDPILKLLAPLPPGVEIAIGGGDPLSHPEFSRFVHALRAQGLIPSVTVNGQHLERSLPLLKELTAAGVLFGVGVSYAGEVPKWDYPHLVLHLIAGIHAPEVLDEAPAGLKVLLLGYKRHGRGAALYAKDTAAIEATLCAWIRELPWVAKERHLSFDNLAIAQLSPQRLFKNPKEFSRRYMGPEGQQSLYIDAVTQTYGLSSYSADRFAWSTVAEMFQKVRGLQEAPAPACAA